MTTVPLPYRLVGRRRETADTVTLDLEPAGEPLQPFAPGQFAMVYAFGVGEIPVSVSGTAGDQRLRHTIRAVGAVSRALCALPTGASVGVRGPFGTSWNVTDARGHDVLVIAGGIGLAPLRPLIDAVLAEPHAYGQLNVLAGARTPDDLLYQDEFPAWRQPFGAVTVDRPAGAWTGRVGIVTTLLDEAHFRPAHTTAFVCGPEVMIRATARELIHRGVPADRVRVSLERNMRCATGHCGHCQLGPLLLCRDGPVVGYDLAQPLLAVREL
ncbi:FAD/NAD(P)-binding protein [Streptomyces sp. NBC_01340]|uniref:FAD/NAD(P)-binding protein n=1 Tax=unclassified Streptomyces TaxID=2593676 RepID=UPI002258A6AC|nr:MULTISPECIES: FAD/NAD(P)-binding protein [unclassified Streptomyces]MCX4458933.1 FAD/NAD(P)-binding protein [Streptomyces sp. NBC_01719]MCX4498290.1 FAD/NAD(P)-binding protein [Streptomyces sp. NBC_01728]MCX4595841.1 FAD/NAD(P)-binding protein [Streptomyces sp. NBC_01549]WSI42806.1 FAD/NAD(P)-binding protein [Streptomyces sp. NBC_01340]